MNRAILPAVVVALAVAAARPAAAQMQTVSVDMQITGWIDVAISGSGVRDLDFGIVFPGVPVTIDVMSAAAAQWQFTGIPNNNGQNNRYADLVFTQLPTHLTGPGGATLPLSNYVARVALSKGGTDYHTYGNYSVSSANPAIDPNPRLNEQGNGGTIPAAPGGNTGRSLVVYLGATVTPAVGQTLGTYIGTIVLTFNTSSTV